MKSLSKSSQIPLYQQVVEWIRESIYTGDLVEDDRIPSEYQIMDMLEVSRGTVKKAVAQLVKEGVLIQVQGKGTFVKKENVAYPLGEGLLSFAESLESQKIHFTTEVITSRIEPANRYVAEKLRITPGQDILYLERLRSIGDEKAMLIENRINIELCPGIVEIDFNQHNLFPTIESLSQRKIRYSESRYAARLIGNERGHFLDISEDAPVLHLEQLVFFSRGLPVEFGNVWLKGNKYYLGTVLQRRPAGLSVEQIIHQLAQPLVTAELVVPDFADHVLEREATYPTGLPTEPPCVAIPHTDHKHVRHNAIAVGILPEPVVFADMGGDSDPVPVRVIFLLALGESNKQLNALGWIMEMIQDTPFMRALLTMETTEIHTAILNKMKERGEI